MTVEVGFGLSYALLWALVVFQSLVLLGVVRTLQKRDSHSNLDTTGSPADELSLRGTPIPSFEATDLVGMPLSDQDLIGRPSVLLFVSPDCHSCKVTFQELDVVGEKAEGNVIMFCRSASIRCGQLMDEYGLSVPVIADEDLELSRLFGVNSAPTAVLIGSDGRIENYGHPMRDGELVGLIAEHERLEELEEVH